MLSSFNKNEEWTHTGKNYLVAIGIDKYEHFAKLNNAVKDVKDIISILSEEYQFEDAKIISLYDEQATEDNIYECLQQIKQNINKEDNLILFFSGHGDYNDAFENGFWIPVDARKGRVNDYIPNAVIADYLKKMEAHHVLVVVDSCFAGTLISQSRSTFRSEKYPSCRVFASGRKEEVSDGLPGGNSPFAKGIIDYLKSTKEDSFKVTDLIESVKKVVEKQEKQTPVDARVRNSRDKNGELVFRRKMIQEKVQPKTKVSNVIPPIEREVAPSVLKAIPDEKEEPLIEKEEMTKVLPSKKFTDLVAEADALFDRLNYQGAKQKYLESLEYYVPGITLVSDKIFVRERINIADNNHKAIQLLLEGNVFFENKEYHRALDLFKKSNELRKDKSTIHLIEQCEKYLNPKSIVVKKKVIEVKTTPSKAVVVNVDPTPNRTASTRSTSYRPPSQPTEEMRNYDPPNEKRNKRGSNKYIVTSVLLLLIVLLYIALKLQDSKSHHKQNSKSSSERNKTELNKERVKKIDSGKKIENQKKAIKKDIRIITGSEVMIRSLPNTTTSKLIGKVLKGDNVEVLSRSLVDSDKDAMVCVRSTIFFYKKEGSTEYNEVKMNKGKAVRFLSEGGEFNSSFSNVELEMDDSKKQVGMIRKKDLKKLGAKTWLKIQNKKTGKPGWIVEDYTERVSESN